MANNLLTEAQNLTAAALAAEEAEKQQEKEDKKAEYESKYMADFLQEAEREIMTKAKEGLSVAFVPFPFAYFSDVDSEVFLEAVLAQPELADFIITKNRRQVQVNRKSIGYSDLVIVDGIELRW